MNVANLLLVQVGDAGAGARSPERDGGRTGATLPSLLAESLLLAGAGGAAGLLLAYFR